MSPNKSRIDDPRLSEYCGEESLNEKSKLPTNNTITKALQIIFYHEIKKKFFIFVEGEDDDLVFYSPVFNLELCEIIPFGGINHVKYLFKKRPHVRREITDQLKEVLATDEGKIAFNKLFTMRDENKLIGIVDLDFEKEKNINNCYSPETYENLFVTETNDAQTLLLSHGGLKIFIDELCDPRKKFEIQKIHGLQEFPLHITIMASYPGLIRNINKKTKGSISFKCLNPIVVFCKFISKEKLLTPNNIRNLLLNPESNSHYYETFDKTYQKELESVDIKYPNRWDLCQGHDIMKILLCIFHHVKKKNYSFSQNRGEEELLEYLSKDFHKKGLFNRSALYSALKKWAGDNFPYPESGMFSKVYSTTIIKDLTFNNVLIILTALTFFFPDSTNFFPFK